MPTCSQSGQLSVAALVYDLMQAADCRFRLLDGAARNNCFSVKHFRPEGYLQFARISGRDFVWHRFQRPPGKNGVVDVMVEVQIGAQYLEGQFWHGCAGKQRQRSKVIVHRPARQQRVWWQVAIQFDWPSGGDVDQRPRSGGAPERLPPNRHSVRIPGW